MRHLPKTLIQLQKQYLDYCTVLYMSGYFTFKTWRSDLEVVQPFCTFALGQKFAMSGSSSLNCKDSSRTFLLSGTFSTSLGSSGFSNSSIVQPRMCMSVRSLYLQRLKLCLKLQMLCLYHTSQIYSVKLCGMDMTYIDILSTSISLLNPMPACLLHGYADSKPVRSKEQLPIHREKFDCRSSLPSPPKMALFYVPMLREISSLGFLWISFGFLHNFNGNFMNFSDH